MRSGQLGKAVWALVLVLGAGCATTESAVEQAPAPTPAPTPTVVGSFEWTSAQVPYTLAFAPVRAGNGFVALDTPPPGESSKDWQVMTSPDGLTWTPAEGAPTGESVMWQTGGPWGAAATIESADDGPGTLKDILYTPDGVQFVRSALVDEDGAAYCCVRDVAVGESGLVVAADPWSDEGPAVLFSADGRTWQKVDLGVPKFHAVEVIAADAGFLLISDYRGWLYSPDGRNNWEQHGLEEGEATSGRYGFSLGTAAGWREGFMILGSGHKVVPRLSLSQDGTSWTESDAAEFAGLVGLQIFGSELGLLAFGYSDPAEGESPEVVLLFSAEGGTWEGASVQDILGHPMYFNVPALGADRIVIAHPDILPSDLATAMPSTSTVYVGVRTTD
jgi:hypothetical protein